MSDKAMVEGRDWLAKGPSTSLTVVPFNIESNYKDQYALKLKIVDRNLYITKIVNGLFDYFSQTKNLVNIPKVQQVL